MRALWLCGVWVACGTDEPTTSASTGDSGATAAPTFTQVREQILAPSCAQSMCHATEADAVANGFWLPVGGEWAAIVDVPSDAMDDQVLVVPGDADHSYLILKLEDAIGIQGSPMPPPIGNLQPDLIDMMRQWIDAGAAND